jgi:hypothetical protein
MRMQPIPVAALDAEKSRQASHVLRGFDYQIWRSVLRWVSLNDTDHLYLECAEDFAVTSPAGDATAVQVKASERPITLGDAQARGAIGNFLKLRAANPGRDVRFQFLTRGAPTHERGRPFGEIRGITVWRSAAAGTAPTETLYAYLLEQLASEPQAAAALREIGAERMRADVCERFDWVTEEPDFDIVQQRLERMLGEHARRQGVSVSVGIDVLNHLLERARQVARNRLPTDRCLTRADFLQLFETKTTLPVPITPELQRSLSNMLAQPGSRALFSRLPVRQPWSAGGRLQLHREHWSAASSLIA